MKISHLDPFLLAEEDAKAVTTKLKVDSQEKKADAVKAIQVTKPGEIDTTTLQKMADAFSVDSADTEKNTQSAIAMIKDPNFEPNMRKLQKQLVQTVRYMEAVLHRVVKFSYNQFLKEPKFQKYAPKEWGIVQAQTKSKQFADNEIKFANFTHAEEANWADWELPNDMGPDGSKVKLSNKQDASQGGELDPDTPDTPAPVATPATPYQEPENSD